MTDHEEELQFEFSNDDRDMKRLLQVIVPDPSLLCKLWRRNSTRYFFTL